MGKVKAIIFDMDGVLIDSEPSWGQASMEVMQEVGIPYSTDDVLRYQGVRIGDIVSMVWDAHPCEKYTKSDVEQMICTSVSELVLEKGVVLPGIGHILDIVEKEKLLLGVATSTPYEVAINFLRRVGITEKINVLCTGDKVTYGKPHPQIYIMCAEQLGVKPSECIVFEDSVNGVIAAKAATMYTVAIPAPSAFNDKRYGVADEKIHSLSEFVMP